MRSRQTQTGFTLVEMVMVIVLMGIVGSMVAVFMRSPVEAYFSGSRRAALTDAADTTVRRIARDLRKALPNSVRMCPAGTNGVEFIPTKTGGRYRTNGTGALTFSAAVTGFNMLGDNTNFAGASITTDQKVAVGDLVVIYNLGITGSDAYAANNSSAVTGVGAAASNEVPLTINSKLFPLASGGNRFHVVPAAEQMVSYVCSGSNLMRTVTNPATAAASCPATGAVIASRVNCAGSSFSYVSSDLQRNGLVRMVLSMQDETGVESISLQHEVHVDNTP